jgi:hypothetical protein
VCLADLAHRSRPRARNPPTRFPLAREAMELQGERSLRCGVSPYVTSAYVSISRGSTTRP